MADAAMPPASAAPVTALVPAATSAPAKRSPSDFLKSVIGRPVVVRLTTGTDFKGILVCLDGFMNIAMEQAEEWSDGLLRQKYGDCFIRGNNVLYVSTVRRKGAAA